MRKTLNYVKRAALLFLLLTAFAEAGLAQYTISRKARKDLNDDYTHEQRELLAQYINEWLTYDIIEYHRANFSAGIHHTTNFMPWHRNHIQMLETFLNSKGWSGRQFVPLPKYVPTKPVPSYFNGLDKNGQPYVNFIDPDYWVMIPAASRILENINNVNIPLPTRLGTDICNSLNNDPGAFSNYLEGNSYHNLAHCYNTTSPGVGGVMCQQYSPAAIIFWPWHAQVDEIWYNWEKECQSQYTQFSATDNKIIITSSTATWNTNQLVKGEVVIESGAILTITGGAIISFADSWYNARKTNITVKAGGKLVIDNATLTGIGRLGSTGDGNNGSGTPTGGVYYNTAWDGIIVQGVASSSSHTGHGQVVMRNGAKIEHARKAILSRAGGRIFATSSTFENNRIDAEFQSYGFTHNSYFSGCTFTTTGPLRDAVWVSAAVNGLKTEHHIDESIHECPDNHVRLTNVKGVRFLNSTWNDSYVSDHATCKGIYSYNSNFTVNSNCQFLNMGVGIYCTNSGCGPRGIPNVYNSTFNNCLEGIVLNGVDYARIQSNTFNVPATNVFGTTVTPVGIFAKGSSGFRIRLNTIQTLNSATSSSNAGVVVENSSANYANIVARNTFTRLGRGTQTQLNNPSLQISCNTYNLSGNTNAYGITVTSGTLANQGNCTTLPAGNTWDNMGCTGNESQVFKNASAASFTYNSHSDIMPSCLSGGVTVTDCGKSTSDAPCVPVDPCAGSPTPCFVALVEAAHLQIKMLQERIDGNRTQDLLRMISDPTVHTVKLREELLKSSPLSDEVMVAAINRTSFSNEHLKDVVIRNSGLTELVRKELEEKRFRTMSPRTKNEILAVRERTSERKQVEMMIEEKMFERQMHAEDGLFEAITERGIEEALTFESTIQSWVLLYPCDIVALEMQASNLAKATQNHEVMPERTVDERTNKEVLRVELNVLNSGREITEITSDEEQQVRLVSSQLAKGSAHADAILEEVKSEDPARRVEPISGSMATARLSGTAVNVNEQSLIPQLLVNYPNPFSESTTIEFDLGAKEGIAYISVYNVLGREVTRIQLGSASGKSSTVLNSENMEAGIYFYSLYINDKFIDQQKMILIK